MQHITTEISIAATPETVWAVLTNFEAYPNWNPFIISITGDKAVGEKLVIRIQTSTDKEMTFKPKVLVFQAHEELRWLGNAGIKGIFDGEHYFKMVKQENGHTQFIHGEKFSGLLVGLMKNTLKKTKEGFERMNEALKRECEK